MSSLSMQCQVLPDLVKKKRKGKPCAAYRILVKTSTGKKFGITRRHAQLVEFCEEVFVQLGIRLQHAVARRMNPSDVKHEDVQAVLDECTRNNTVFRSSTFVRFIDPKTAPLLKRVKPVMQCAGWLDKRKVSQEGMSKMKLRQWNRRFVVLQDYHLHYYAEDKDDEESMGQLRLEFVTVELEPDGRTLLVDIWSDKVSYRLRAEDAKTAAHWLRRIRRNKSKHMNARYFQRKRTPSSVAAAAAVRDRKPLQASNMSKPVKQSSSSSQLPTVASMRRKPTGRRQDPQAGPTRPRSNSDESHQSPSVARRATGTRPRQLTKEASTTRLVGLAPYRPSLNKRYYRSDEEGVNIVFNTASEARCKLRGGTKWKLVEKLLDDDLCQMQTIEAFLLTYHSIMSPSELMDQLTSYFERPPAAYRERTSGNAPLTPVQLRVIIILTKWLELHFMDFKNANLTASLLQWIGSLANVTVLQKLRTTIKRQVFQTTQAGDTSVPPSFMPTLWEATAFDLTDFDVREIARQMTLVEAALFRRVHPREFHDQAWLGPNRAELTPSVCAITERFNMVASWATTVIVKECCRDMNNYCGMMEIVSGLASAAVNRLKRTWERVPPRDVALMDSMRELMASTKSFKCLREALRTRPTPCIPYLGMFLSDLVGLDVGNRDTLERDDLINFEKRVMMANVLKDIKMYQSSKYNFAPIPALQSALIHLDVLSEDAAYDASLRNEPRAQ